MAGSLLAGPLVAALGVRGALTAAGVFVFLAAGMLLGRPLRAADGEATVVAEATP